MRSGCMAIKIDNPGLDGLIVLRQRRIVDIISKTFWMSSILPKNGLAVKKYSKI